MPDEKKKTEEQSVELTEAETDKVAGGAEIKRCALCNAILPLFSTDRLCKFCTLLQSRGGGTARFHL